MKNLFFLFAISLCCYLPAQTKLSYVYTLETKDLIDNKAIISATFGTPKKVKNTFVWEKNGAGFHYKIRLKPKKVNIRYTGKAKQMERKIKAIRKKIRKN